MDFRDWGVVVNALGLVPNRFSGEPSKVTFVACMMLGEIGKGCYFVTNSA